MARILPIERLLRISQAPKTHVDHWKEGVLIEQRSGRTVPELALLIAVDRWRLASAYTRDANKLLVLERPLYRSAVSRYYYSMYHALRACVYIFNGGDDYQEHVKLPQHIPADFDPGADWQTKLKNARVMRNRADYDPYPKADKSFRSDALSLKTDSTQLLALARQYLRTKGCAL